MIFDNLTTCISPIAWLTPGELLTAIVTGVRSVPLHNGLRLLLKVVCSYQQLAYVMAFLSLMSISRATIGRVPPPLRNVPTF